ncbi:MAG: efflux RND transporter permease subunit [Verrucomicrobiales bacterium]|nr:efflux RND transporter permease subunit [Verrucomicrobiales bacterium]
MIEKLLQRGTLVAVVVAMLLLLGIVAATRVPVQMIPDLETRVISVDTAWPSATPQDIEKEILIEQELFLRTLPNLQRMTSLATTGRADIELEFPYGIDTQAALIQVNNALSQVPSYPENVDEPVIRTSSFSYAPFLYFRTVPLPGNPMNLDLEMQRDFIDNEVRPQMERVEGVSRVRILGGAARQIRVEVDPARLAERNLSLAEVRDAIRARNTDVSAGDLDSGKRRYLIRTVGRFADLEELRDLIIVRRGDAVIRLRDLATVELDHAELRRINYSNGAPNIWVSVVRQTGSNVIEIKNKMLPLVDQLNEDVLRPNGLEMSLSSEDVSYVEDSVSNVVQNIIIGAALAALVMFLFLRSGSATLIGMLGMPICIVAGFIGLLLLGRTINVISLAGIAFAIGMTIDNTIVVLESISQERNAGKGPFEAARDGVRKVWAAVLSGTMTTVLVFLPVLFIEEEAGQLFSDIGIAISASIIVSMLVAVAVVPVASANFRAWKSRNESTRKETKTRRPLFLRPLQSLISSPLARVGCIVGTAAAIVAVFICLTPPAEYLPEGEEAKAFSAMNAPPGYTLAEMDRIAREVEAKLLPALDDEPEAFDRGETEIPALDRVDIIVSPGRIFTIAVTKDYDHIDEYMEEINRIYRSYPGMRAFSSRGSIISSNDGGTRAVALDISGPELPEIYATAQEILREAESLIENAQIDSDPGSLILAQPLLEIRPKWERLEELGFNTRNFGFAAAALSDGAFVDEFYTGDDKIDIFLYSEAGNSQSLDNLETLPIYTPQGTVVPLGSLATINESVNAADIRRVDGRRTVTLYVIPPRSIALETAVDQIRNELIRPMRSEGRLPPGVQVDLTGASDQLDSTRKSLGQNLWIAVALCYLQLVIIYRHWGFPFLILVTVPLGIGGGIVGLWLLNTIGSTLPRFGLDPIQQPFDMITMLGFLILLGTSVNNPILIVDRTMRNFRDEGMGAIDSVKDAVAVRLRPVLMTTATTLMGLSPLVFLPGAGTELYRGLGAIVLFGLAFSALVTLTFLPCLLATLLRGWERWQTSR